MEKAARQCAPSAELLSQTRQMYIDDFSALGPHFRRMEAEKKKKGVVVSELCSIGEAGERTRVRLFARARRAGSPNLRELARFHLSLLVS